MRLLLDTKPLLWWLADDDQVAISAATVWEIERWRAEGRLDLPDEWLDHVAEPVFRALPVTVEHAALAGALAPAGGDDVDRVLVAQAQLEGFAIVARDPGFVADVEGWCRSTGNRLLGVATENGC